MKSSSNRAPKHREGYGPVSLLTGARAMTLRTTVESAFEKSLNSAMQDIVETIKRVAASHVNVIITGESGTGKEWVANMIHSSSPRSAGRLITVECAALTPEELEREVFGYEAIHWKEVDIRPGALEKANEGTVLLNEIALVPPALMMRISRSVEFQSVRRIAGENDVVINTRLISTMSIPSHGTTPRGTIPNELLHRLSPIQIELPPLRKRREDIPVLVEAFLSEIHERSGSGPLHLSHAALQACVEFDWPGNLRHLRNAVEYASVMCGSETILPEHLPPHLAASVRKG
jgi:DNA-binding NtrC family response regulator